MANLRDGGIIVVGVRQEGQEWFLDGIDDDHYETYDADDMVSSINKYGSPHVDVQLARVDHGTKRYLAISVKEFRDTPIVCKRNGPNGVGIHEGAVYIRAPGVPRTTRVTNAHEMHELLDLAAEKRSRRFFETHGRVTARSAQNRFDEELEGL